MLLVHDADHLLPLDLESRACSYRGSSGHVQRAQACERLLSNEVRGGQKGDGGLLAIRRNDRQFCSASLEIEDSVSRVSLGEEGLFRLKLNDSSSEASFR